MKISSGLLFLHGHIVDPRLAARLARPEAAADTRQAAVPPPPARPVDGGPAPLGART